MSAKFSTFGAIYSELRNYGRLYELWDIYGLSDDEIAEFYLSARALDMYELEHPQLYYAAMRCDCEALKEDKYICGNWLLGKRLEPALSEKAWAQFSPIPF